MSDWFTSLAARHALPAHAAAELDARGFVVLPNMVAPERLERLIAAYAEAVTSATGDDIRIGSTSTKVTTSSIVGRPSMICTCFRRCSRPAAGSSAVPSS